ACSWASSLSSSALSPPASAASASGVAVGVAAAAGGWVVLGPRASMPGWSGSDRNWPYATSSPAVSAATATADRNARRRRDVRVIGAHPPGALDRPGRPGGVRMGGLCGAAVNGSSWRLRPGAVVAIGGPGDDEEDRGLDDIDDRHDRRHDDEDRLAGQEAERGDERRHRQEHQADAPDQAPDVGRPGAGRAGLAALGDQRQAAREDQQPGDDEHEDEDDRRDQDEPPGCVPTVRFEDARAGDDEQPDDDQAGPRDQALAVAHGACATIHRNRAAKRSSGSVRSSAESTTKDGASTSRRFRRALMWLKYMSTPSQSCSIPPGSSSTPIVATRTPPGRSHSRMRPRSGGTSSRGTCVKE